MCTIITPNSLRDSDAKHANGSLLDQLRNNFVQPPDVSATSGDELSCSCSLHQSASTSPTRKRAAKRSLSFDGGSFNESPDGTDGLSEHPEDSQNFSDDLSEGESVYSDEEAITDSEDNIADSDRAKYFAEFLEPLDDSIRRFNNLDNTVPRCCSCEEPKDSEIFCNEEAVLIMRS